MIVDGREQFVHAIQQSRTRIGGRRRRVGRIKRFELAVTVTALDDFAQEFNADF